MQGHRIARTIRPDLNRTSVSPDLIDAIVMTPDADGLRIELKGNLAAMLSAATHGCGFF
jgi:hypothetical protein